MGKSQNLLQGTLDLLILHALRHAATHGYAIAQRVHLLSDQVLVVEEGSLYPALSRLELDGCISSTWGGFRKQPKGEVLRDHSARKESARRRTAKLATVVSGYSTGASEVRLRRTIRKLILRRRLRDEIDAELAHHRELSKEHGNPIGLGNAAVIKEDILDERRFNLLENVWRDQLFALRRLRKNLPYSVTATGSIALGIGVCTAMFAILNAVALRPLPYVNSEKLVWITQILKANSTDEVTFTPDFLAGARTIARLSQWRRTTKLRAV
jgi:DNA-binding PadR family transcriptional regulator